jgi:serine/threonine protein phosphatase PrpC
MPLITAHASAAPRVLGDDRIALLEHGDVSIVIVADGAGGLSGGAVAAERLIQFVRGALAAPAFEPLRAERWALLLERVDLELERDPHAGETTAVVVAVSDHGLVGASAGDSAAWVVHPDRVDDLTAGQHRKRRLGSGTACPVTFARDRLAGTLVVATDGLMSYAPSTRIAAAVRQVDLGRAARELIQLVRLPSGELQDDVGVVLVRA